MFGVKFLMASVLVFSVAGEQTHPIHLSVTEITFDEKERELEIVVRAFTDDIELAIQQQRKQPALNVLTSTELDKLLSEYLISRVGIVLDGKVQTVKYLGHEIDADAFVFYMQVQPVKKWQTVEIKNSILTEVYEDQSNLINVTRGEKTKSLRLMRDNVQGKLTFDIK